MRKFLPLLLVTLLLQGCVIGHVEFYQQVAPSKFPPTQAVKQFEYSDISLNDFYKTFFSDFLIIGRSSFNGRYEDPNRTLDFAKSIGADVFISTSQFKGTRTTYSTVVTPTTSTSYMSGMVGSSLVSGTATTYGTTTTTVPVQVNNYNQNGLYLKNVNKVLPLWERTAKDYPSTEQSPLSGTWKNENYTFAIYKSDQFIVATLVGQLSRENWKIDDVKFVYDVASGVGIYLMGSKAPMPADFALNKFGHLEVKLSPSGEIFAFERVR